MSTSAPRPARTRTPRWPYVVVGLAAAGISLVVLLWYGGGSRREALPGLPDPGVVTGWALPAARLGSQIFAVATIGLLLAAVFLSPRQGSGLSATGYRRLRAATWTALGWAACGVTTLVYTLADLLGRPVGESVTLTGLASFASNVTLGKAIVFSTCLAAAVAVISRVSLRPGGAVIALGVAVLAVIPSVFTGHAASAGDHNLAVSSMLLHVIPVTLWAGGLLALVLTGRTDPADTTRAVHRFSVLATVCLISVALSGVLSALVRLSHWGDLFGDRYGQLVLVKTVLLVGLAGVGLWQRRAALPALRRGDRRTFARVTVVEIGLFGLAMGTAVALSRTATPIGEAFEQDLPMIMLGFPMPPPLTFERLLGLWLPDPLFITAALVAAGLYLTGVVRLLRRGDRWPIARTAVFLAGCAVIVVATTSGLARYGPVLFSVHMGQHLLVGLVAPILLVLSAPVTLALRVLPRSFDPAWPGPREWLLAALRLPITRLFTHPVVALLFYAVSMYAMYLTDLFELALRSHAAHLLMMGHFLLAGYLFYWVVIGVDPAPRHRSVTPPASGDQQGGVTAHGATAHGATAHGAVTTAPGSGLGQAGQSSLPPPLRMLLVIISMVLHALLGIIIMQSSALLAHDWFTTLPRSWGPTPLDDQYTAGAIAWTFGEIPSLIVACALFFQWIRADEREQRRLDRAADRAEAEGREDDALAAYNAMLAELKKQDSQSQR